MPWRRPGRPGLPPSDCSSMPPVQIPPLAQFAWQRPLRPFEPGLTRLNRLSNMGPPVRMTADRLSGDLGRKLREARERRGTSLREIANATKIAARVLEAPERNDISRLPGGIFSRAFVRAYAVEVGLPPDETVQEFIAQFPDESVRVGHPAAKPIEDYQAVESSQRAATTFLSLVGLSIPIAIAVLYFATAGRRVPAHAVVTAPVAAAPSPVPPPSPAAPRAAATPDPPAASVAAPGTLTVVVSTSRACWISAKADGAQVIQRTLQAGDRQTIDVRQELVFTAGDATAVTLTLNGTEARPLGKSGEVVTARFSPANFRDYL